MGVPAPTAPMATTTPHSCCRPTVVHGALVSYSTNMQRINAVKYAANEHKHCEQVTRNYRSEMSSQVGAYTEDDVVVQCADVYVLQTKRTPTI